MASGLVIEATVGAAFGGVATPIVNVLIAGLKIVWRCKEECRDLVETLARIQPSVEKIFICYKDDCAREEWLKAFDKCVMDAQVVMEKCKRPRLNKFISYLKTMSYGGKILKLRDRINQLLVEAPLLLHEPEMFGCEIRQDVPERIFGMEDSFMRVKSAICEGHRKGGSSCVGIRGMGGAGKTLLAQMVNNDEEIQEVFGKDLVVWITVGRDAIVSEVYKRMRHHLHVRRDGGSLEDQRTDLMNAFATTKVLLILDDVWDGCVHESKEMIYWLNIAKGSKCVTLVTTRDEAVTRQCVNAGEEIILKLSQEQSWQLFCSHAFGFDTPNLDGELEGIARAVCNECDCLPLALRVIGCAMKGKSDWRRMLRQMRAPAMPNQSIEQQLYKRLQVSYDELDGPTKICFLYFAAFPEDHEVWVIELCQIWVVEGLFGENLSEEEAMEEAHCALKELMQRSLIEVCDVASGGALERVKMHDILRDLAIHLVSKGNECERECLFKIEKEGFVDFPNTWLGCELKVRRLFLWGGNIKNFPDEIVAPNLRICILYGDPRADLDSFGSSLHHSSIGEKFFEKLLGLKFLRMRRCLGVRHLPGSMGELSSLQHLDLSQCQALEQLPENLGGLRSLRYLDLFQCLAMKQLPGSMGGLGSLIHLSLSRCKALKQLPKRMGGLRSLQHLNLSFCGALGELPESMGGLESLQYLNLSFCRALKQLPESMGGLRSLQHLNLSRCMALKQLPKSMGGLRSLQHLDLSGFGALKQLLESLGGLGSLQHLNLSGCVTLEQLPESMGGLGSLQYLYLSQCWVLKQLPESMGGLGSLQHLNLSSCMALKQLTESMGGLGSLQHLNLSHCEALEELPESMGGLRSLQHLNLSSCMALKQLPESMGGLGSLQHLDLSNCLALKHLPGSMERLGSLQHINIFGYRTLEQL